MSNEIESVEENVTETAATPVEAKKDRLVTMQDGSVKNFGVRANLLTNVDHETGLVTFDFFTGETISFNAYAIEGQTVETFTAFQKQVFIYGLLAKVKTALAPIKVDGLFEAVTKQLDAIAKAEFSTRGHAETVVGLSDLEKAYALAKVVQGDAPEYFSDLTDVRTIEEVQAYFATLTTGGKNKLRNHPKVALELAKLRLEEAEAI
jgi:hypothetical protein